MEKDMTTTKENNARNRFNPLRFVIDAVAQRAVEVVLERQNGQTNGEEQQDSGDSNGEIRYLIRLNDQLNMLRGHIETRAGLGKRSRKRWRREIQLITRLMKQNHDRLHALGVELMPWPDRIDYARHVPVRTITTNCVLDDGRIIEIVQAGYVQGDRALREMQVVVLKHVPNGTSN